MLDPSDDPTLEQADPRDSARGYHRKALPQSDEVVLYDQHGRIDWDALARTRVARRVRGMQALLDQFPQEDE